MAASPVLKFLIPHTCGMASLRPLGIFGRLTCRTSGKCCCVGHLMKHLASGTAPPAALILDCCGHYYQSLPVFGHTATRIAKAIAAQTKT